MVRFAARLYLLSISLAIIILSVNVGAQGKPEKEKIRIGYAARAVTHSIPYLANEAGLFRDEGLQVEIVRTAGAVSPMALISGDTDFATMSAFLLIPVSVRNQEVVMALAAMAEVGVKGVEAVGLAKMRVQSAPRSAEIERSEERVFLPGQSNPIVLKRNSNALFLLQRVRDEAHRFAITHHKKLRARQILFSALDRIPGVGGARKRALLRTFGSIKRIEKATLEELLKVPSMTVPFYLRL